MSFQVFTLLMRRTALISILIVFTAGNLMAELSERNYGSSFQRNSNRNRYNNTPDVVINNYYGYPYYRNKYRGERDDYYYRNNDQYSPRTGGPYLDAQRRGYAPGYGSSLSSNPAWLPRR